MKLSIVTPSYNQGKFIKKTFESILDQDIDFELEYILVDAVSTDETTKIVEEFIPKFKAKNIEFIYICEKDTGQSNAINKGWKLATGDILAYLNSDDFYEPNVLQKVMDYFIHNPKIKWAYGGWNLANETGKTHKTIQHQNYKHESLLNYCNIGQPSCFFRKQLIEEIGMLNEELHLTMDYDLWLRFATKYPAGIMNFIISNMRYYPDAKSGKKTKHQLLEGLILSCGYSKSLSFRRMVQYFYFLRGTAVLFLGIDITRRINNHKR
jgi:glycosyltransferase involved in cell wall biosynthesis